MSKYNMMHIPHGPVTTHIPDSFQGLLFLFTYSDFSYTQNPPQIYPHIQTYDILKESFPDKETLIYDGYAEINFKSATFKHPDFLIVPDLYNLTNNTLSDHMNTYGFHSTPNSIDHMHAHYIRPDQDLKDIILQIIKGHLHK